MKKITLSLLAIFAFAVHAHAQNPESKPDPKPNYRIKTGLNISNITDDPTSKSKAGFHLGFAAEFFISEKFAIQPELQYSTQGAKADSSVGELVGIPNADITMKMNYLNIPIMAKYYVAEGLSIQMGPQIGFKVKSEMKIESNGVTITGDMDKMVNSVDFGLNFGVGYDLDFGLFFDARYNLGLTKFNKIGDESNKHSVFQLGIGYKF